MDSLYEDKKIKEKMLKERIIFLDDEITPKKANEIVYKLLYLDSINHEDIKLFINSPGGSISNGLMIYDTINLIKSDVQTISMGTSASMAAILLLLGTKGKRMILPNSKVMLHDLSAGTSGKYNDMLIDFEQWNKTHEKMHKLIKENTNLTEEIIETKLKTDYWLTSEEALKFGIVDKIITEMK